VLKHARAGKNLNLQAGMIFFTLQLEQLHKNLFEEHKQTIVYTFQAQVTCFTFTMEHTRN